MFPLRADITTSILINCPRCPGTKNCPRCIGTYQLAVNAIKSRWGYKLLINPLKITAEATGRASLSKSQVFFFTLIVAWLSIYWVMKEGELVPLSNSIIILLGIAAGGAGLGRVAGTTRSRVTGENWACPLCQDSCRLT